MSTKHSTSRFSSPHTTNYEYRSQAKICGWPLVHITRGINPETRQLRIARGIVAVGDIAIGVFSLGGISLGMFSLGGISIASYAFGGIALGGVAVGGISVALCTAIGVLAVSPGTTYGFQTITPHLMGIAANLIRIIGKYFLS
jgi:hypothetical protein